MGYELWLCRSGTYVGAAVGVRSNIKGPSRTLMYDLDHLVDYTARVCVVYRGVGKGPFGLVQVN